MKELLTHPLKKSSPDLRSLSVQGDGNTRVHTVFVFVHLVGNPDVVDRLSVILVRSRVKGLLEMMTERRFLVTRERNSYERRSSHSQ